MVVVKICVGSSCHLKGSYDLVQCFQGKIEKEALDAQVELAGSFCFGECNRNGVTVSVNDQVYPGVVPEQFEEFWAQAVAPLL